MIRFPLPCRNTVPRETPIVVVGQKGSPLSRRRIRMADATETVHASQQAWSSSASPSRDSPVNRPWRPGIALPLRNVFLFNPTGPVPAAFLQQPSGERNLE